MPRDQQRLADYLGHIAEAIERIVRYTGGMDEVAVLNNQLVQDAVIRNFEIIGRPVTTLRSTIRISRLCIQNAFVVRLPDAQRCCAWLLQGGL